MTLLKEKKTTLTRRNFLNKSVQYSVATSGFLALPHIQCYSQDTETSVDNLNIIGPKEGFSPQIGTLVSMMNWMRNVILYPVRGMSVKDLDYIHDENSNSIGGMLYHLAAIEYFYQKNTFEEIRWGNWSAEDRKKWSVAAGLGEEARSTIKGKELDFYLDLLKEVRENTLKEFARRDDAWLLSVDESWGWGPTNNYCKWFHVCEHESNHNGQIKWIKSRIS